MVISFMAEQGGVGKTSLCFNLAWYLASQGKKILILDWDHQAGNLTSYAGIKCTEYKPGMYEVLEEGIDLKECIIKISPNLSVVPANENSIFVADVVKGVRQTELKKKMNSIEKEYDYVFIDTSPTPSTLHIVALGLSKEVIIPITAEGKTIDSVKGILDTYKGVKEYSDIDVKALVYNNYETRRTLLREIVEEKIRSLSISYGVPVAQTKIVRNIKIAEAVLSRTGITDYEPVSKGADSYRALSKELFGV